MKLQTDDFSCGPVSIMNAYYSKHKKISKKYVTQKIKSYMSNQ